MSRNVYGDESDWEGLESVVGLLPKPSTLSTPAPPPLRSPLRGKLRPRSALKSSKQTIKTRPSSASSAQSKSRNPLPQSLNQEGVPVVTIPPTSEEIAAFTKVAYTNIRQYKSKVETKTNNIMEYIAQEGHQMKVWMVNNVLQANQLSELLYENIIYKIATKASLVGGTKDGNINHTGVTNIVIEVLDAATNRSLRIISIHRFLNELSELKRIAAKRNASKVAVDIFSPQQESVVPLAESLKHIDDAVQELVDFETDSIDYMMKRLTTSERQRDSSSERYPASSTALSRAETESKLKALLDYYDLRSTDLEEQRHVIQVKKGWNISFT